MMNSHYDRLYVKLLVYMVFWNERALLLEKLLQFSSFKTSIGGGLEQSDMCSCYINQST